MVFLGNTKEREEKYMKCPKCGQKLRQSKKNPDKMLCDNCRKSYWIDDLEDEYSTPVAPFKTWKLVSGILSIVLFVFVTFQSCAAGIVNTVEENGEVGGSAGVIVAIMLLAGGIVSIATRKGGKGGNIAIIVLFGIGALCGFTMAGSYGDLYIWSAWCLICVILAIIALIKSKK